MTEKFFTIEGIEPIDFYGVNEIKLQKIKGFFPKIQIVGRGDLLKVSGDAEELEKFETRFFQFLSYIEKYGSLSLEIIDRIMQSENGQIFNDPEAEKVIVYGNNGKAIKPRTENQFRMVEKIRTSDLLFATGPAGTGKTYVAIALAIKALRNREVRKIVLSRPAVEAGERLGFLPGDVKEKVDPYLQALYDALNDILPPKKVESMIEDGTIEIAPLAFMRGRTLHNAFVILDEAQNSTTKQLKMFLTRMGENSKFIVTGDITQIDLPSVRDSGLVQAVRILKGIEGIEFVRFTPDEIVRHKLVRSIVLAYERDFEANFARNFKKEPNEQNPQKQERELSDELDNLIE